MKKEQRKEFELQIIRSIEQLLSTHDSKAAGEVRKHIKDAGKSVAKKFYKAAKTNAAQAMKASVKSAAKTAVAVAAVTTKSPGSKKVNGKNSKPVKKNKK